MGETTDPLSPRGSATTRTSESDEERLSAAERDEVILGADPDAAATSRPVSDYPFVTGVTRTDYVEYTDADRTDAPVSDEVAQARAEIEQTRAEMTETIDAIKEKLSPAHLVAEAKEAAKEQAHSVVEGAKDMAKGAAAAVSEKVTDAVDAVKAVVAPRAESAKHALSGVKDSAVSITHRAGETASGVGHTAKHAGETIVDTIKLNPVPAAVAGFGLGWLLLSMRKQDGSVTSSPVRYDAYNSGDTTYVAPASSYRVSEDIDSGPSLRERASDIKHRVEDVAHRVEDRVERIGDRIEYRAERMGDALKANPLPLAAAGVSLGWLFYTALRGSSADTTVRRYNVGPDAYDVAPIPGEAAETHGGVRETLHHAGERVGDAAHAVKEKASDAAHAVGGAVSSAASTVGGAVSNAASTVGGAVSSAASSVGGAVSNTASAAKDKAVDVAHVAREKAGDAATTVDRFIHEQPIAAGAVALIAGLTLGLILPTTRKESELLGPTRDKLVDRAQDVAQDLIQKAQNVAQEAVGTAKESLAHVKDEVTTTVRDEARNQGLVSSAA